MSDDHQIAGAANLPGRVLPDPAICRARVIGQGFYGECLVGHPFDCKFAVSFGGGYLCHHPQVKAIAERTNGSNSQQLPHDPNQPPSRPV